MSSSQINAPEMGEIVVSNASLLYFPIKQFSPRFGDCFFTVEILSFKKMKASSSICIIGDVIFYEISVKRGKQSWTVFRRYNEFAALFNSLEQEISSSSATAFPQKSFFNNIIYNPNFLEKRMKELEVILDKILTEASTRSTAITSFTAVTSFLELGQKHDGRIS